MTVNAIVDRTAYVLANPTAAGLVRYSKDWQVRACRSDQRWHPEGVDNVLTLPALSQSEHLPGAI